MIKNRQPQKFKNSGSCTSQRSVLSWALYDFAGQPFATLIVTFIYSTYFASSIAQDSVVGMALWSRAVTVTGLVVAVLSPIMGAWADCSGYRKRLFIFWTWLTITACCFLFFAEPGMIMTALIWFTIGNISFEMGIVICNAYLPHIAPTDKMGRISGFGWGMGYAGGLLALWIAMTALINPETPWFGFTKDSGEHIRAVTLLAAGWFAVFSLPAFLWVRDSGKRDQKVSNCIGEALKQIRTTWQEVRQYKTVVRFLTARLFYNDGLLTIFAFGGIFAAGTLGFSIEEIFLFGIVINLTAGIGALLIGLVDDHIGSRRTILLSTAGLILAVAAAVLAREKWVFWAAGIIIGICSGPNQASSRVLMARLAPPEKINEFFGFYALSGKATAFAGPLVLGIITELTGSQRLGVASILMFLIVGFVLLWNTKTGAGD